MEEQLPLPILDLLAYHLYLSAVSIALTILALYYIAKMKGNFTWPRFLVSGSIFTLLTLTTAIFLSFYWPTQVALILGPFHLPYMAVATILLTAYWKLTANTHP